MKRIAKIFTLIIFISALSSCKDDVAGVIWGETEYFTNFIGYNYEPTIMEKTLELDFNEDAKRLIKNPIEFEVAELSQDGSSYIKAEDIKVYKNGSLCPDNTFSITTADTEVTIGIEFLPEAAEGYHKVFIHEKDLAGLDRVDYTEIGEGIVMNKICIYNPLAKWLVIVIGALIILYLLWYLFVIIPKPKVSRIELEYSDGSSQKRIHMSGCYELVCTNDRNRKDSFFRKLLYGTRKFEYNDFWTHEATISPISSQARSRIKIRPLKDFNIIGNAERRETFSIENADGSKQVTITTS